MYIDPKSQLRTGHTRTMTLEYIFNRAFRPGSGKNNLIRPSSPSRALSRQPRPENHNYLLNVILYRVPSSDLSSPGENNRFDGARALHRALRQLSAMATKSYNATFAVGCRSSFRASLTARAVPHFLPDHDRVRRSRALPCTPSVRAPKLLESAMPRRCLEHGLDQLERLVT